MINLKTGFGEKIVQREKRCHRLFINKGNKKNELKKSIILVQNDRRIETRTKYRTFQINN